MGASADIRSVLEGRVIAVDFETTGVAGGYPNEPWQLGAAVFECGRCVETREWFFNVPLGRPFAPRAPGRWGELRGELDVAPAFADCLPEISDYLVGSPLVAHNASTERTLLTKRAPLTPFGPWFDTLAWTRTYWPAMKSYKLGDVVRTFGLEHEVTALCPGRTWHDALFDAVAGGLVAVTACRRLAAALCALFWAGVSLFAAPAEIDWRIVAADQGATNLVMFSGAPGASTNILWRWNPFDDPGVKPEYAATFAHISECKPIDGGKTILTCASFGGVAAVDVATARAKWYALASRGRDGPHSVDLLPNGHVAVANSVGCDALEIIDVASSPFDPAEQRRVRAFDVSGAHGVVWDASRKRLFVLGYTNLYAFAYAKASGFVMKTAVCSYADRSGDPYGHDLVPDGKGSYYFTNHTGVWRLSLDTFALSSVRLRANAKSFSRDSVKGDLLQIPIEKWWSDRLTVIVPDGSSRTIGPFPGSRFYKARWLTSGSSL